MDSLGWLTGYDVPRPFGARRAHLIKFVTCGARDDFAWVKLDPPIMPGEAAKAAVDKMLEIVLLIPRHAGVRLSTGLRTTIHVHVTTVGSLPTVDTAGVQLPEVVLPEQIRRRLWALLIPDEEFEGK